MEYTRTVEALKEGTVIDHIPAGQGLKILRLFRFADTGERVTVGLNLSSRHMGSKDIIKVENVALTAAQANELALFAPKATVNLISNFEVVKKHKLELPEAIEGIFACPNSNCISHTEPVESHFYVRPQGTDTKMKCKYCEKVFSKDIVAEVR
ncbi:MULTISPECIES: aspartate carbamoyltransferase regulatory subunit [Gulbenkiania]|uniref:Aspartate carbamoyltransferase regulatory chain n=2 Tax=Gulbenkiania TaxID=397456 RepID=A0A0K6GWZ5_9NEIS|nr:MULTISPECIES: aspartate carbamoyltransferase regulatory subunit [Gulbenkiania]TCW32996.1 aspartate carbamoyltransferase regulatory subunit [Gulbenkiania mobilis]CUA83267.1 aspartate carbamoyltransferase, regulatory subunit [Gulbenkiania indica]